MSGACSSHGGDEKRRMFVGKPEGNRPLKRN
jgi:hypothetical protein